MKKSIKLSKDILNKIKASSNTCVYVGKDRKQRGQYNTLSLTCSRHYVQDNSA